LGTKQPLPNGAVGIVKAQGKRIVVYIKHGEKREDAMRRVRRKHGLPETEKEPEQGATKSKEE